MAEALFTQARKNEVFFKLGKFGDGTLTHKHVHAPFDLLHYGGGLYVVTRSIPDTGCSLSALTPFVGQNLVDEEWYTARDMFPTELNPVVMGEHEMGNWAERGNDWTGLQKFGFI